MHVRYSYSYVALVWTMMYYTYYTYFRGLGERPRGPGRRGDSDTNPVMSPAVQHAVLSSRSYSTTVARDCLTGRFQGEAPSRQTRGWYEQPQKFRAVALLYCSD